jgi:peptidoglycan biosynthesis protein MviN/MurJ (putative lipid II flippase)
VKQRLAGQIGTNHLAPLFFSGVNTLASVVFQLGVMYKLGIGARSDLYYASIVMPLTMFTLAFGALNNVLIPMFVQARAKTDDCEATALWNCLLGTFGGGALLLVAFYYPIVWVFPRLFHKLTWIDLRQVGGVVVVYSVYQILFSAGCVKNCYLFAQERPVSAQLSAFWGWLLSLVMLVRLHSGAQLSDIPMCLVWGNVLALVIPNFGKGVFRYQRGLFWTQMTSLRDRNLPLIGGGAPGKIEPLFDGVLASFCPEGSLTIYYFFSRVMLNVVTVTFAGYMQPAQKALADLGDAQGGAALRRGTRHVAVWSTLVSLALVAIGCGGAITVYSVGIRSIQRYVQYIADDWLTFLLLMGYVVGMVVYVAYSNTLNIMREERRCMWASLAVFPVGLLCKFIGAYLYKLPGLALGTSVSWLMLGGAMVLAFSWRLRTGRPASGGGELLNVGA